MRPIFYKHLIKSKLSIAMENLNVNASFNKKTTPKLMFFLNNQSINKFMKNGICRVSLQ